MNFFRKIKRKLRIGKKDLKKTIEEIHRNSTGSIEVIIDDNIPECSICLEYILDDLHKTKCNHIFHNKCINDWLNEKNTCPLCRRNINRRREPSVEDIIADLHDMWGFGRDERQEREEIDRMGIQELLNEIEIEREREQRLERERQERQQQRERRQRRENRNIMNRMVELQEERHQERQGREQVRRQRAQAPVGVVNDGELNWSYINQ